MSYLAFNPIYIPLAKDNSFYAACLRYELLLLKGYYIQEVIHDGPSNYVPLKYC